MPRAVPAPRIQGRLWQHLLRADAPVTAAHLSTATRTSFQTAMHRLELWAGAGLVTRSSGRPRHYSLSDEHRSPMPPIINSAGQARNRQPAGYQRLWSAIRVLRRFDLPALRLTAGTSERSTLGYVGLLQRCGYVQLEQLANARTGQPSRYSLRRNTGPQAPRETLLVCGTGHKRVLLDQNTGEQHDVSRGTPSRRRSYRRAPVQDGGVS